MDARSFWNSCVNERRFRRNSSSRWRTRRCWRLLRASSCAVCALRDARCCSSAVSSSRASRSMAASFRSQVRSCACDRISTSRRSSSALAWRMILSHWCCTRRRATFAFCASRCRIASISACLRRRSAIRASSAFMASSRARSCSSSRSSSPGIVPVDCGLGYRRSRRGVNADAPRSVRVVGGRAATFVVPPRARPRGRSN